MNLSDLTHESLIMLDASFTDRFDAINQLVEKLNAAGILSDKQAYVDAVLAREAEAPTALGEGLAVPHGKSDGVRKSTFAFARLNADMPWQGIDGDEPVDVVFLLAIPTSEAGTTHIRILSELSESLMDDTFRAALAKAATPKEVMALFGEVQPEVIEPTTVFEEVSNKRAYAMIVAAGCAASLGLFMLM